MLRHARHASTLSVLMTMHTCIHLVLRKTLELEIELLPKTKNYIYKLTVEFLDKIVVFLRYAHFKITLYGKLCELVYIDTCFRRHVCVKKI